MASDVSKNKVNITIFSDSFSHRAIPEIPMGGWGYNFLKTPYGIFRSVTLPLEIPEETRFYPWKFCRIVWHPWKFQRQKPRPVEIPHEFFVNTPENSTSCLTDPWNFQCNRSQKNVGKHLHVLAKEIYFLYMWSSKRVKNILPPPSPPNTPHTSLSKSHPQLSAKFHDTTPPCPPPSLCGLNDIKVFFRKKISEKNACAIMTVICL